MENFLLPSQLSVLTLISVSVSCLVFPQLQKAKNADSYEFDLSENFLLPSQLFVLTLISVSVPPLCFDSRRQKTVSYTHLTLPTMAVV